MAKANKEVAVKNESEMALMNIENAQLEETFRANFQDEEIAGTLDRVRMPSGGQTAWTIETLEGEEEYPTEILGVIISFHKSRVYWESGFDEEQGRPDCISRDGKIGVGNPGGRCDSCPLSKFGENDESPPCREQRIVFVLPQENILPIAMVLPPTSILPFKKYLTRLGSRAIPVFSVVTSFKLEKETSNQGIKYSKLKISLAERLSKEEIEKIKAYTTKVKELLSSQTILEDYANNEQEESDGFDIDDDLELALEEDEEPESESKPQDTNGQIELITAEEWWNRLPEKEELAGAWQKAMTRRFYIAMGNVGFNKVQAKLWAEQTLGKKEGSIVSMNDIVINGDYLYKMNKAFYDEYKTPLYGKGIIEEL